MPTVSIKGQNQVFNAKLGQTIFDALEEQNYELPHGCLAGSCGACRVVITAGLEFLKPASEVEENTLASLRANYKRLKGEDYLKDKNLRLTCRAKIEQDGNIEIDFLS